MKKSPWCGREQKLPLLGGLLNVGQLIWGSCTKSPSERVPLKRHRRNVSSGSVFRTGWVCFYSELAPNRSPHRGFHDVLVALGACFQRANCDWRAGRVMWSFRSDTFAAVVVLSDLSAVLCTFTRYKGSDIFSLSSITPAPASAVYSLCDSLSVNLLKKRCWRDRWSCLISIIQHVVHGPPF